MFLLTFIDFIARFSFYYNYALNKLACVFYYTLPLTAYMPIEGRAITPCANMHRQFAAVFADLLAVATSKRAADHSEM